MHVHYTKYIRHAGLTTSSILQGLEDAAARSTSQSVGNVHVNVTRRRKPSKIDPGSFFSRSVLQELQEEARVQSAPQQNSPRQGSLGQSLGNVPCLCAVG